MALTSIYNQDEKDFEQKKRNPIGFLWFKEPKKIIEKLYQKIQKTKLAEWLLKKISNKFF
jgi:hypothetical protein